MGCIIKTHRKRDKEDKKRQKSKLEYMVPVSAKRGWAKNIPIGLVGNRTGYSGVAKGQNSNRGSANYLGRAKKKKGPKKTKKIQSELKKKNQLRERNGTWRDRSTLFSSLAKLGRTNSHSWGMKGNRKRGLHCEKTRKKGKWGRIGGGPQVKIQPGRNPKTIFLSRHKNRFRKKKQKKNKKPGIILAKWPKKV